MVRRWAWAFLARAWEGCVMFGRLSAGERLTGTGTCPGRHPERVPSADETSPEDLAFWAQVHALRSEALPRGRRGRRA